MCSIPVHTCLWSIQTKTAPCRPYVPNLPRAGHAFPLLDRFFEIDLLFLGQQLHRSPQSFFKPASPGAGQAIVPAVLPAAPAACAAAHRRHFKRCRPTCLSWFSLDECRRTREFS